ncbi:MAG: blaR1 8 [Phycisphaerales bacterium]|nr:blaR1 8 [Phycisphaerales bacterium]
MTLQYLLSAAFSLRLVETLGHFLWQGTVVALMVLTAWPLLRRASSRGRYGILLAALGVMAACPPVTFILLRGVGEASVIRADGRVPGTGLAAASADSSAGYAYGAAGTARPAYARPAASVGAGRESVGADDRGTLRSTCVHAVQPYATGTVTAYFVGVGALMGRLIWAVGGGRRLRKSAEPVKSGRVLDAMARQARAMGMRVTPAMAWCGRVATPMVIGTLRPVILLPVALATELSAAQVEAILAHELAHVRRYDHVVNMLQGLAEAFLFFHPAVWLVSGRLREERENCCDDAVLAAGGDAHTYAEALVRVAELARQTANVGGGSISGNVALAATGRPSRLRLRVRRILGLGGRERFCPGRSGMAVLAVAVLALVLGVYLPGRAAPPVPAGDEDPGTSARDVARAKEAKPRTAPAGPTTRPAAEAEAAPKHVLLVTSGNYFLEKTLHSLDWKCEQVTPKEYEARKFAGNDVVVFDRYVPRQLPADVNCLFIGELPQGVGLKAKMDGGKPVLDENKFAAWKAGHPIARAVEVGMGAGHQTKWFVGEGYELEASEGWDVVAEGTKGPLAVTGMWKGRAYEVLPFDLLQSNLPLKVDYVIFMNESLNYLAAKKVDAATRPPDGRRG